MNETNETKEPGESLSRRDFLRRTGKQAVRDGVDIGTRIMPGGAIVRRIIETDEQDRGDMVEPKRRAWWDKLVSWKQERQGMSADSEEQH